MTPTSPDRQSPNPATSSGPSGHGFTSWSRLRRPLRPVLELVLWLTVAISILSAAYLYLTDRHYVSQTDLYVDPGAAVSRTRRDRTDDPAASRAIIETQIAILTSGTILGKVFDAEQLMRDPEYRRSDPLTRLLSLIGLSGGRGETNTQIARHMAFERFANSVAAERLGRAYVIRLTVTSRQQDKAQRLAAVIARTYLTSLTEADKNAGAVTVSKKRAQLKDLDAKLQRVAQRLASLKARRTAPTARVQSRIEQDIRHLDAALSKIRVMAENARTSRDLARGALRNGWVGAIPAAIRSPALIALQRYYGAVVARHGALSATLLPQHPQLLQSRRQLNAIDAQIRAELQRLEAAASAALASAIDQQHSLQNQLQQARAHMDSLAETPDKIVAALGAEIAAIGAARTTLASRLNKAQTPPAASHSTRAHIISAANLPLKASAGAPATSLVLALLGSLGLAVIWRLRANARALALPSIRLPVKNTHDPANPAKHAVAETSRGRSKHAFETLNEDKPTDTLPVIATIARLGSRANGAHSVGSASISCAELADIIETTTSSAGAAARTRAANGFRNALGALADRLFGPGGAQSQIIALHGAHHGAGTTATALALGLHAARDNKSVLLVDGDCANPELSQVFSVGDLSDQSAQGLSDLLVEDENTGLHLLPLAALANRLQSGKNHSNRLSAPIKPHLLRAMLRKLANDYDLTLIDGGMAASNEPATYAATSNWTSLADQHLLCARVGILSQKMVGRIWRSLCATTGQNGGIILTMTETVNGRQAPHENACTRKSSRQGV